MAAMDVAMFEDPLLLRCDSLWGCDDDLLTLLNCDMALDDELPTLPLLSPQLPTAAACGVGLGAHQQELHVTPPITAPAPPPLSPQTSSGSGAAGPHYLPCAVCKGPRRSASPSLSGNHHIAAPSLPALQGTGTAGAWRTVTTTAQPASASHNAAPPAGQPIPLTRMPSSATSGGPPTSSSEDAAPPPAKQPRSSAASRARRPAASKPPAPAAARKQQPAAVLSEDDTDSEDSNDTEEHLAEEGVQGAKSNKRKAPEIDWRSIEDPAERRRQRRLAKNRVTAARSRERKKSQWAEMEDKLNAMEAENRSLRQMLESMSKDNEGLRAQLAAALGGAGSKAASAAAGAGAAAKGGKHTHEPAVLLIIVTLLVCAFLPSSSSSSPTARQQAAQAPAALGGALLLAELLLRSSTKSSCGNWSSKPGACSEDNVDAETDPMQVDAAPAFNTPSLHGLALGALAQPLVAVKSEPGAGSPGHTAAPPGRAAGAAALLHALLLCVLAALRRGVRAAKGLPPLVVRRVQQAAKAAPAATSLFRQSLHSLAGPFTACAAI